MQFFQNNPWMTAGILAVLLFVISVFVPIPLFDGVLIYDQNLVHIESEAKIALSYLFQIGLEKELKNSLLPTGVQLKPIGWVVLFIIHVGLPILVGLRIKMGKARKELETKNND